MIIRGDVLFEVLRSHGTVDNRSINPNHFNVCRCERMVLINRGLNAPDGIPLRALLPRPGGRVEGEELGVTVLTSWGSRDILRQAMHQSFILSMFVRWWNVRDTDCSSYDSGVAQLVVYTEIWKRCVAHDRQRDINIEVKVKVVNCRNSLRKCSYYSDSGRSKQVWTLSQSELRPI